MLILLSWNGQENNMLGVGDPASLLSCLVLSVSLPGGGWSGKVTAPLARARRLAAHYGRPEIKAAVCRSFMISLQGGFLEWDFRG